MIYVGWGNTAREYIVWKFVNDWTVEDYKEALEKTAQFISDTGNVPLLVDVRRIQGDTFDILKNPELHRLKLPVKHVILISMPDALHAIYNFLSPLFAGYDVQFELVDDVDLAYSLIAKYRTSSTNNENRTG